ncbi:MAG: two-component system activity regulator YycH [Bacillota bacterium]|nr:two-component system activity regulator YycH [Bacillota bacterium]
MNKSLYIERLKTILIVVLFLSTVLLSYFYWHTPSFSGIRQSVNEHFSSSVFTSEEIPDLTTFVSPGEFQVNFGNGIYTVYQHDSAALWDTFVDSYIEFTGMQNLMIEEITEEQWRETMDMKSIQYIFDFDLPVSFFESLGAGNFGQSEYFDRISAAAISEASTTSLFVRDDTQGKYFRIISDSDFYPLEEKISEISSSSPNQYYPIYMFLGTENYAMAPYVTNISLPILSYTKKSPENTGNYEKDLAKTFFGESLDFIRKLTDDNGTIIYMYGYGEKMLTIYKNGEFDYQDNLPSDAVQLSFGNALSKAVSFIANHGSWSSYDGEKLYAQLKSVSDDSTSKMTKYRFRFMTNYSNYTLYGSESSTIEIEVTGDQITFYSRDVSMLSPDTLSEQYPEDGKNALITDILSAGYQSLAKQLIEKNVIAPEDSSLDLFDVIVKNISSIEAGYFGRSTEENSEYVPSWIITFSNYKVFFNLYTGEYLGYFIETEQ